ncbi:VWA domain-containing protein [Niabella ginsengisoli]|uniref:VWA domain-containing protein n=1 Tax=Niabella ginsengisoli TaxID=522298 RepID=A0ABS9SDT7_9BACT|nr:VWA domain-containing protein [Niabella ginsengisoli]MCH5596522.1 VWA domain-containing protein [Niabella ginsengisoli]
MNNFQFQYSFFIWLLLAVIIFLLLFIGIKKWKRRVVKKIGTPSLVKAMLHRYSPRRFTLKFVLICIAFIMGVLAVMNLRKPGGSDGITREGIDVVFALDVSRSMLAEDIEPNRLERAKQLISKLMDALPESRVGLILFAGKAYVQMPLSSDHGAAQMFVSEASPDAVPMKGTVISDALQESLNAFGERDTKYRAVVLISDGEDHDEESLDLSKELAQRGLMVNTVGIGSPAGSFIPDDSTKGHKIDEETGVEIISKLNEQELKQIANNTKGIYVHLENSDDAVKQITANLSQIDKKVTGDTSLMSFSYYFWIFVGIMLVLLIWEQLLPEGRRKKSGKLSVDR